MIERMKAKSQAYSPTFGKRRGKRADNQSRRNRETYRDLGFGYEEARELNQFMCAVKEAESDAICLPP